MAIGRRGEVLRQFRTLFEAGTTAGLSDEELLDRSASRRGEAAESAFSALVERHGPMVLRVCKKAIGDPHEAHDAFQSTFLVLARKAGTIRDRRSVASWLHGVALRVSATSRADLARRRKHERRKAEGAAESVSLDEPDEVSAALHEEVGRLPGRYRAAVVLCYLEGKSHELAASQLGCPVGTIKSRLSWARDRLRDRLTRRGFAPAAGAITALLASESAFAAVPLPAVWVDATTEAALSFAAGKLAAIGFGTVPASSVALAKGVIHAMLMNKIKLAAIAGAVVLGATSYGVQAQFGGSQADLRRDRDDSDRLRSLERKLDRLIDVMERQAERQPNTPLPPPRAEPGPIVTPAPRGTTPRIARQPIPRAEARGSIEDRLARLEMRMDRLEQRFLAHPDPGPAAFHPDPERPLPTPHSRPRLAPPGGDVLPPPIPDVPPTPASPGGALESSDSAPTPASPGGALESSESAPSPAPASKP